eukprot:11158633-Lingulodinium_polyedra.AAC.1
MALNICLCHIPWAFGPLVWLGQWTTHGTAILLPQASPKIEAMHVARCFVLANEQTIVQQYCCPPGQSTG